MSIIKPALPKGTRDFGPDELRKRNYIFGIIRNVFEKYGFQPLETPAMENLSTLTGKYGDEGDKLLFKILNSGDYFKEVRSKWLDVSEENLKAITSLISEKGLRYDLTIPFARYVVQHQHEITFPFKRYQIQPVWRADRPQKGRYREFYQCDADVIGSDSLLNEVELILIYDEVFRKLGLDITIRVNSRKIINGICEAFDIESSRLIQLLDKIDKANIGDIESEFAAIGARIVIRIINEFNEVKSNGKPIRNPEYIFSELESIFNVGQPIRGHTVYPEIKKYSANGLKGMSEIEYLFLSVKNFNLHSPRIRPDISLVRGLDYYTGTILEVKANNVQMGSIGGGGRYDNLTGVFGLPGVSGVGISFGVERIYDVMEELNLFPEILEQNEKVLFVPRDESVREFAFLKAQQLRNAEISAEIFLGNVKKQKHFSYAEANRISYIVEVGESEVQSQIFRLRNVNEKKEVVNSSGGSGFTIEQIIQRLKNTSINKALE